jgi:hypothetical protein
MLKISFLFSLLVLPSLTLLPREARAQTANSDYSTKAGDDCVSVAMKAYGDRRAVELIHKANPQMGPVPHVLKPGTVLHLPPKEALAGAPDAHVTFVRNKVTVQAAASKSAEVNDPLFRTNRVSTANASSANVTFRDETQIRVGEESLVIILGDVQGAAKKQAADATLVEGHLQTRLGELAGKRPLTVDTEGGARITMSTGSALVGVDAVKTTRLAVHAGSAAFAGVLGAVSVPKGYGSKAERGKAPTPPKPLPAPPSWIGAPAEVVFVDGGGKARVKASYGDAGIPGKPKATSFRVKVAHDTALDDVVSDTVVPAAVTTLDAQGLTPGTYFFRVSAIDDDTFESPAGATAKVIVVSTTMTETTPGRARLVIAPGGVACTIDGKPHGDEEVDATTTHTVMCSIDAKDPGARGGDVVHSPGAVVVPVLTKPLRATATLGNADPSTGRGVVEVELRDAAGAPVVADGVVATASNGVSVESVRSEGSKALVSVRFPATARPFVVTLTRGALVTESNVLRIPAPRDEGKPRRAEAPVLPARGFEIAFSGGFDTLLSGHGGRHLTLGTSYRTPLASKVTVALGPSVTLARFEPTPVSRDAFDPAPLGDTSDHTNVHLAIPVALRLFPHAFVSPYLSAGPELAVQRSTFSTGTKRITATGTLVGGRIGLGAQAEAGPGWVFLEAALRGAGVLSADPAAESLSGATLDLGYRFTH